MVMGTDMAMVMDTDMAMAIMKKTKTQKEVFHSIYLTEKTRVKEIDLSFYILK